VSHDSSDLGFGTRAIRAATRSPRVEQEPDAVPIYQAVTFSAEDSADLGDILADRKPGYSYSRIDNPTSTALGAAVAEVEGAQAGFAFATGMAAVHATLLSLVSAGDHIVASQSLYGSVRHLLEAVLGRLGVHSTFVDITNLGAVAAAITDSTRLVYAETIANPTIVVADIPELAVLAHARGLTLVIDNTFASPYICRPIEHGADLVIEAATKWLGGHSDVLAGVVVGGKEEISAVRAIQTDTGGSAAPFSAFLVLRGLETLHVRMERSTASAQALARLLEARQQLVNAVYYPGLPSHPQFSVAQRVLRAGGGMLAFDLGQREAAAAFIDALTIPPRTASLGSIRTMTVHPPSSTHRQLDEAGLRQAGISAGLVRVSVGLEDVEDLAADFERGLAAASAVSNTTAKAAATA
jgi:cystathionine beta-lyase/cystathionine gamma-synthase